MNKFCFSSSVRETFIVSQIFQHFWDSLLIHLLGILWVFCLCQWIRRLHNLIKNWLKRCISHLGFYWALHVWHVSQQAHEKFLYQSVISYLFRVYYVHVPGNTVSETGLALISKEFLECWNFEQMLSRAAFHPALRELVSQVGQNALPLQPVLWEFRKEGKLVSKRVDHPLSFTAAGYLAPAPCWPLEYTTEF